jgi:hypothetical protein
MRLATKKKINKNSDSKIHHRISGIVIKEKALTA